MKTRFDLIKMKLNAFPLSATLKIRTWQQYFQWLEAPVHTPSCYFPIILAGYLCKSTFI